MNCFLFDGLNDREVSAVFDLLGKPLTFNKGDELYKNGTLGIITEGNATVKRLNAVGDKITIRTIFDGELFGAASIFGTWKDGMSSIVAENSGTVVYIDEDVFCELLKVYPQISLNYITYLSDKIRFLNRKLDAFTAKSTEERLYEYLLSQSDSAGNVNLQFGITELSRRLQVGRTSIYRDIQSLESKKLISRNGCNFKIF